MNQLYICWKDGPKTIKEEFDVMSSRFSKNSISKEDMSNMERMSKRKFIDFIPENCFVTSNVPAFNGNTEDKLNSIFDFVMKSPFSFGLNFFDCCNSIKEMKLSIVIQAILIEILYNNHNIGILLSEDSTNLVYNMISNHFDIKDSKIRPLFKRILSNMLYDEVNGFKTICSYEINNDVCYIALSTTQTLCHHTIWK